MAELELTKAQWAALEVLVAKRDLVHGGHARSQMDPPTVNSLAAHALHEGARAGVESVVYDDDLL